MMSKSSVVARVLDGDRLECQVVSPRGERLTLTGTTTDVEPTDRRGSHASGQPRPRPQCVGLREVHVPEGQPAERGGAEGRREARQGPPGNGGVDHRSGRRPRKNDEGGLVFCLLHRRGSSEGEGPGGSASCVPVQQLWVADTALRGAGLREHGGAADEAPSGCRAIAPSTATRSRVRKGRPQDGHARGLRRSSSSTTRPT